MLIRLYQIEYSINRNFSNVKIEITSDDGKLNEYNCFIRLKVHEIVRPAKLSF